MPAPPNAEWDGIKVAALANAIRDRLKTLVDELDATAPKHEMARIRLEIQALVEQFPEV